MTRADQPMGVPPAPDAPDDALAAESRERAVGALLRFGPLRRLWSAHLTSGIGDALALLVLLLLALQAATVRAAGADAVFGGGYRGMALVITAVFGARLLATLLFGAVLLGPLSALLAPGKGVLDRRWTMFASDALRALAMIVAPMWIDWMPGNAFALVLVTVFVLGVAERFWTVAKDSAAPALLPAPPPEGAAVRPLPDRQEALRRLWLRSTFLALPVAAIGLVAVTLVSNALSSAFAWFHSHQAALGSYVAAGLFAAAFSVVYFLELPDGGTPRPRSPLEGLRRPRTGSGSGSGQGAASGSGSGTNTGDGKGRTGAVPLLVLAGSATAWAIASAVAIAALHAADLGGGPISFGLQVFALAGGTAAGIRLAPRTLPLLSRRRLLALAIGLAGLALLVAGLVTDATTGLVLMAVAGLSSGVAAQAGHVLLDLETEDAHRARMTEHLQAVVRIAVGLGALVAPVAAGFIGPHRVVAGDFVFDHGGAAFTLMLVGALLLPVAALVLGRTDDRQGVTLRRDLLDALGGGRDPKEAPAANGFFMALEGGDGSGKTTQVETLAEWIRAKGHEVVVTKEPGATPVGKRLRSILLDVSSAGLSHRSEALLYAADRAEHVDTVIRPALERGAIVLSDRYIDSSVAYQGAGRDLSPTEIARISRWATAGLVPHLTVLLDIAPETARERFTEAPDRLESEPAEFHDKVRAGFLTLAAADPARYLVVDAGQEPEAVTTAVRHRLDQVLPLSDAEIQAREDARRAAEEEARRKAEEEAARKAEEERRERERQEKMDRLRAEEQDRKRRAEELERQQAEARRAEEARRRAEEARRIAEEERQRRDAEERAREEEIARQRRLAEEEARLRAQAEERRLEKQRRAEEALQRAEQARNRGNGEDGPRGVNPDGSDGDTAKLPQPEDEQGGDRGSGGSGASGGYGEYDAERTHVMPQAQQDEDTTLLPRVPAEEQGREQDREQRREQGRGQGREQGRDQGRGQDRQQDRTREMPQVDPGSGRGERPRPDWAEETPLDDVPSLADELLGGGEDDAEEQGGRRRRRGK
ncbi:dTMP kinase [Streptomyces sp. HNM0575]|uniref:dTMP kinase n=1 Tax=Streptomyces sp. HNM0575 TaxID=2716338 RepID=UPI00145E219B|nr:dTMP kinase [Streptomyces sp. HNM0575]NLU75532.1 dTMP kinase [Streptomyces sp. HNM0575]